MKLSEKTLSILKNFSSINQSILIKKGNKLRTVSLAKNILAEAEVEEDFPKDFGIYDLSQFLVGISLHADAELDFANDTYLSIRDKSSKAKYFFSDPAVIVTPPDKDLVLPTKDVCFVLDSAKLTKMLKASAAYQLPDLAVVGEAGVIKMVCRDKKNDTSNEYAIIVGETDNEFTLNYKVENIRIIPGTYEVVISSKGLSEFTNTSMNLKYYIALEPDSVYNN